MVNGLPSIELPFHYPASPYALAPGGAPLVPYSEKSHSTAFLFSYLLGYLFWVEVAVGSLGWEPLWGRAGGAASILWEIRLPRTLGAWLTGALPGGVSVLRRGKKTLAGVFVAR